MSFNIVSILKSSSLPKELTLENIYNYASELSSIEGDNFSFDDLVHFINNRNTPKDPDEPVYTGSDDDWVFSNPITPKKILPYHNDINLHKGYHYCSRPCNNAKFLCGNSFYNNNGGLTKCGHISYSSSPFHWTHECKGSFDLFFLPDGRPNRTIKTSYRRNQSNAVINYNSDPYFSSDDEYFPDDD